MKKLVLFSCLLSLAVHADSMQIDDAEKDEEFELLRVNHLCETAKQAYKLIVNSKKTVTTAMICCLLTCQGVIIERTNQ